MLLFSQELEFGLNEVRKISPIQYDVQEAYYLVYEEIDVFEHEVKAYAEKSIVSIYAAGNPMALIVLSLFTILITSIKTK